MIIEIPEVWIPRTKQNNSQLVSKQTVKGIISCLNNKDQNPAINNNPRKDWDTPITINHSTRLYWYTANQNYKMPDKNQQYRSQNTVIQVSLSFNYYNLINTNLTDINIQLNTAYQFQNVLLFICRTSPWNLPHAIFNLATSEKIQKFNGDRDHFVKGILHLAGE